MNLKIDKDILILLYIVVTVISIIFLNGLDTLLFMILFLITCLIYLSTDITLNFLIVIGIVGSLTESVIILLSKNTWSYKNPELFNVPIWLPLLWAIAGSGVISINNLVLKNC